MRTFLSSLLALCMAGCFYSAPISNDRFTRYDNRMIPVSTVAATTSVSEASAPYPCPDLFEGHIFSCPTVPTIGVGMDIDTDAIVGGIELECVQNHGGICIVPGLEYGRGSQDFGDVDPETGDPLTYSVIQVKVQGRYAVPLGKDSPFTFSPFAGPRYYRFSYSDCPFEDACSENLFLVDVGGGVRYGNVGLDAYTALGGPSLAFRLKYLFGGR